MTGSEVATRAPGALSYAGAPGLDAEDFVLPRLYLGQSITTAVEDGLVESGAFFVATDKDDADPTVLAPKGSEDGVVLHVLALRKGKSVSIDGELTTYAYDDPNAPEDAWTTYTFAVAIPSYDSDLPVRWLLTRTGRPAAQKINTILARAAGSKAPHEVAFRLTAVQRQNDKGRYYVPRVQPIEASEADVEVAATLAAALSDSFAGYTQATSTNAPAI